jgi:hypothetical protein
MLAKIGGSNGYAGASSQMWNHETRQWSCDFSGQQTGMRTRKAFL